MEAKFGLKVIVVDSEGIHPATVLRIAGKRFFTDDGRAWCKATNKCFGFSDGSPRKRGNAFGGEIFLNETEYKEELEKRKVWRTVSKKIYDMSYPPAGMKLEELLNLAEKL